MKTTLLLALGFITHIALGAHSGPEISFWDTTTNPATLRLPPLIRSDVRQANNNNPASAQSFDISTLRLSIDAIRRGNLVINHGLRTLILTRATDSNAQLTQEQIDLLVEYYPNINMLCFNNIMVTPQAVQTIASQFSHVTSVTNSPTGLTTQEIMRVLQLQGLLGILNK